MQRDQVRSLCLFLIADIIFFFITTGTELKKKGFLVTVTWLLKTSILGKMTSAWSVTRSRTWFLKEVESISAASRQAKVVRPGFRDFGMVFEGFACLASSLCASSTSPFRPSRASNSFSDGDEDSCPAVNGIDKCLSNQSCMPGAKPPQIWPTGSLGDRSNLRQGN